MKNLNRRPENCRRSGVIGLGLIPGHEPAIFRIRVTHGHNQREVTVPSNASFGHLKSFISQNFGLKPEACKLIFRGIEKQDNESLQIAGVKNNSEVILVEDASCEQHIPEEIPETPAASKGEDAVADVRKEVDKLEQQVSALQAVIDSGKKVDNKEIVYLTEMLMRQLLKLDGIEAEGEGKVQRKTEVRRVQIIVETLDTLKSRNSNSSNNTQRNAPSSFPSHMPSSTYPVPYPPPPSNEPQPTYSTVPHLMPSTHPFSNFQGMSYPAASPMPHFSPYNHHPYQYHDPSQRTFLAPYTDPSLAPYHDGSSYMPHHSDPRQNWERFG